METKTIARINKVAIVAGNDSQKLVPIKPICEALGIDFDSQRKKIKEDEDLNSVTVLSTATGADNKQYEMFCLPLKFIFGWLFTINPKNVKPEAQEVVRYYRMECYSALYSHFTAYSRFNEDKQAILSEEFEKYQELQANFNQAKKDLAESKKRMNMAKDLTFEEWEEKQKQMTLDFEQN
ncbi:hypothetical protein A9168_08360 [Macellibacteroides sp. HH-ZS]|nr:hypothetical protein A9168_08360 [Macellibacteroides sp. HH-ZS]